MISIEDFQKLDLRIATILDAHRIELSEKLVKLEVDLGLNPTVEDGHEKRQIIAGIGKAYEIEHLIGKQIVIIANLEPRMLMGQESQGMVLAAEADKPILLTVDKQTAPGSKIR